MKRVRVAGVPYTIVFSDDIRTVSVDRTDNSTLLGQTDYLGRTIRLYKAPNRTEERGIVFLHELVHAIVEAYSIDKMVDDSGKHVEANIDRMAIGLYEALKSLGINITKTIDDVKK